VASAFNPINSEHRSNHKFYSVSGAAKTVGLSPRQLHYWERVGIVKPTYEEFGSYSYRRYSEEDIQLLAKIKRFLNDGYTLRAAAHKVMGGNGF
jgi:DNA-binding transcriptional MerR regulator